MSKTTKKELVLELLESGMDVGDIAKKAKTSKQYVYSVRYKAAAPKKQPATANGKVDAATWLEIRKATLPKPKVGYEVTVHTLGLDKEELDDLLESARVYGTAEVTKVVDLK